LLRLLRVDGDGDDNLVRVPTAVGIYTFHMHSDVAGEGSSGVEAEAYDRNNGETPTEQFSEADRPRRGLCLCTFGVVMYLELVSGRGGSLVAKYFTRDLRRALAVADKLKAAGLRPNVVRSGPNYVVYIATADLEAGRKRLGHQEGRGALSRRKGEERRAEAERNSRKILQRHLF
jgi:hypothetical protein